MGIVMMKKKSTLKKIEDGIKDDEEVINNQLKKLEELKEVLSGVQSKLSN